MKIPVLLISAVLAMIIGCSRDQKVRTDSIDSGQDSIESAPKVIADTVASVDPCVAMRDVPKYWESMTLTTKKMLLGPDSCVIEMIDSVVAQFVLTGERRYIVLLDSITSASDGYIGEYLNEVMSKVFYARIPDVLEYLGSRRMPDGDYLRQHIIGSLSMQVTNASDKKKAKMEIEKFAEDQIAKSQLNPEEVSLLREMVSQIDENYW